MEVCPQEFIFFASCLPFIFKSKDESVSSKQERDNKSLLVESESEFYQWFVGFSDAESSFFIQPVLNSNGTKISRFSFKFMIELHKDDRSVLEFIQKNKLKIGNLRLSKDKCIFIVSDKAGLSMLIKIFDKYNLNTTKYLDYLNFKNAFVLYYEREKHLKVVDAEWLKDQILEIKNLMNTKRTDFNMNHHKVVITKNWFLGFIEGDGSFFLSRTKMVPVFSIELTEYNLHLLLKIKEFLILNLGFDKYSTYKLRCSSVISINKQKARLGKPSVTFVIQNINILNNSLYLI